MTYFFILGNNPSLSVAEIIKVLPTLGQYRINCVCKEVLIADIKQEINPDFLQKRLGGTIKIGQIFPDLNLNQIFGLLPRDFKKVYPVKCRDAAISPPAKLFNRVNFGFSVYPVRSLYHRRSGENGNFGKTRFTSNGVYKLDDRADLKVLSGQIKNIALDIKERLREQGISSRWVSSKQMALSSVIVKKNKLLNQGMEIVLLKEKKRVLVGRTLACQEFEEYGFYDFARPFRAIEKGMLPPKLAKIMINLSSCFKREAVILDPFCGSGTILQQAILMGYEHIIGIDKDKDAVHNTRKNLEWLIEKQKISARGGPLPTGQAGASGGKNEISKIQVKNIKIFQGDARESSKILPFNFVDAIITEPYLGPLRFKIPDLRFIIGELSQLYISVFKEFRKVLKAGGRVVIIFPAYKIGKEIRFLPILEELEKIGWQAEPLLPDNLFKNSAIKTTRRRSIIYSRPDQKVLREIFVFKLNKQF